MSIGIAAPSNDDVPAKLIAICDHQSLCGADDLTKYTKRNKKENKKSILNIERS